MTCGVFSIASASTSDLVDPQNLDAAVVAAVAAIADRGGAVIDRAYRGPQPPAVGVTMSNASAPLRKLLEPEPKGEQSGGCSSVSSICIHALDAQPPMKRQSYDDNCGKQTIFSLDVLEIALTPSMVTIYLAERTGLRANNVLPADARRTRC